MSDEQETTVPLEAAERILDTPAADLIALARKRVIPKFEKGDRIPLLRTIPRLIAHLRAGVVTLEEAGAAAGVTAAFVWKLLNEGYVRRAPGGGVVLVEALAGYIRFLKDDRRNSTIKAGDNRVRDARAREIELRTARDEQELVPTEEGVAYMQAVIGLLMSRLNGLPASFTRDLDERRRLEASIDTIRDEVAEIIAEHGPAYRGLPDTPEADTEDRPEPVGGQEPAL